MNELKMGNYKVPFIFGFAAFIIVIAGMMYAESIITQLLLALFISIICAQPISWLQKRKVPGGLAIAMVFIGILSLFFGFGELVANSLSSFSENMPQYEANLREMSTTMNVFLASKGLMVPSDKITELIDPAKIMGLTAGILGQLGNFMGKTLTIVFLVLFLLLELDSVALKAKAISNNTRTSMDYLVKIEHSIRHYLSIKTSTSLLTGFIVWISLVIVGVDYAIIWGLIAFLLNYIPTIGSIIAALPAVLFATVQLGFMGALWTTIIFIVVNMVIGNIVEPKLMGKGMGLSTFIVFVSLIFWGFIFGTVGMFLSVPLTMAIKIMLEQNPNTKWAAVVLGTDEDAKAI